MKAFIDRDNCISCGLCVGTCPEVFRMAEDDYPEVYINEMPLEAEKAALEAKKNCPVSVIKVE